ncbi:MAG: TatD family hydrolase [Neisseria sp.]|nr:TatD family hydrolase [Neisseria sp.]
MFFDTHCHFNAEAFRIRLPETLQAAYELDVTRFLNISAAHEDWPDLAQIARTYENITPAFGIHPLFLPTSALNIESSLPTLLQAFPYAAIGEIGLDFYHHPDLIEKNRQEEFFARQIAVAHAAQRPIVLHQRKAHEQCLAMLKAYQFTRGGFAHAFSGSLEQAKQWLDMGFVIGVGTVLLHPAARKLPEVLRYLPADGWVLESDAPFMMTGNQPSVVAKIAQTAAAVRGETVAEIARQTTANALRILYGNHSA